MVFLQLTQMLQSTFTFDLRFLKNAAFGHLAEMLTEPFLNKILSATRTLSLYLIKVSELSGQPFNYIIVYQVYNSLSATAWQEI